MKKLLKNRTAEGYIDTCVLVVCAMLVVAFSLKILPIFIAKQQLDTYAAELVREAEISGCVGEETDLREQLLSERMNISPTVEWSETGNIQLNHEVSVTVTLATNLGFGEFGSFPITLTGKATGKSEVYWKQAASRCGHFAHRTLQ